MTGVQRSGVGCIQPLEEDFHVTRYEANKATDSEFHSNANRESPSEKGDCAEDVHNKLLGYAHSPKCLEIRAMSFRFIL